MSEGNVHKTSLCFITDQLKKQLKKHPETPVFRRRSFILVLTKSSISRTETDKMTLFQRFKQHREQRFNMDMSGCCQQIILMLWTRLTSSEYSRRHLLPCSLCFQPPIASFETKHLEELGHLMTLNSFPLNQETRIALRCFLSTQTETGRMTLQQMSSFNR